MSDIAATDTNEVFILTANQLIKSDGQNYTYYPINVPSFIGGNLCAVRNDLVYISGANLDPNTYSNTRLLKWDGNSITEVSINVATGSTPSIGLMYAFSENEIWMCGSMEGVFKFNGNNFDYYELDSGYHVNPIFKVGGQVFCTAFKNYRDSTFTYFKNILNVYELGNNSWTIAYSDTTETGDSGHYPFPYFSLVNNSMYSRINSTLFEFTGSSFNPVLTSSEFYFGPELAGQSLMNLMVVGTLFPSGESEVFHWNGVKWSREMATNELSIFPMNLGHRFINIRDHFILMGSVPSAGSYVYTLKPR